MRKISFSVLTSIVLLFFRHEAHTGGLPVNLSSYRNYSETTFNGLKIVIHSSITNNKEVTFKCVKAWQKNLSTLSKICPDVINSFANNGYKIYLYRLPSSRGGMEFIRDGQNSWDKRLNIYVNKGIIIPRAYMYSSPPHDKQGLVYLLHEMAHYKHVVTLGESGKNNSEIKAAYLNSLGIPKYAGTYARKNHLEYFAEISVAYLLKSNSVTIFPSSSRELYSHDKVGYNLCKKMWGGQLAAYKPLSRTPVMIAASPSKKPPVISMSPFGLAPEPPLNVPNPTTIYFTPPVVPANARRETFQQRTMAHATKVYKTPSKGELLTSRQFLEIKNNLKRAETEELSGNFAMSNWIYSNSLSMLENFKNQNPYWHTPVIKSMILRVKSKLN